MSADNQNAITTDIVWATLKNCFDPEIPVNIVDLGLVYEVTVNNDIVNIKMTLTAPGCPMARRIATEVQNKVLAIPGVREANVELVWDPPWHPGLMSEDAKKILGF
jgi:metal-sulfur cluster biosynthetic enzyme